MANAETLHFETDADAADWFDDHDPADDEDQLQPVEFSFDGQKNRHWAVIMRFWLCAHVSPVLSQGAAQFSTIKKT